MRFVMHGVVLAAVGFLIPAIASAGPAPAYQWSGLYGGAQAGYGLGASAENSVSSLISNPWRYGSEGGSAGLFAGYNQVFGNWVGGAEVEANWGNLPGHYYDTSYGGPLYTQDWSTAERLRLGYLANPSTLFYGSIGLAQGNMDLSDGYWAYYNYGAPNQTVSGVQFGAGVESFVTPNLSLRLEGTYTQYGKAYSYSDGSPYDSEQLDTFAARVGIAYHPGWLGGPTTAAANVPVGPSWAGMYVGGKVGATMLNDPEDNNPDYETPYDPAFSYASKVSASVGTYAGYNWQMGNIVAGIEAGADLPNVVSPYSTYDYIKHDWSAGVRGRLGIVTAGNTLLYASLGWTVGHFDYSGGFPSGSSYSDAVFTDSGLQIGLGAEAFLTSRLSMRFETIYTQYGTHDILYEGDPYWNVSPRTLEASVGLTYHLK